MVTIQRIDLSPEIKDWKEAEYGEEVRDANVSAFEKIQTRVNESIDAVIKTAGDADGALTGVDEALERANDTIDVADATLTDAKEQVGYAADQAQLAESWAVGATGARSGEDTDNSKYYSGESKSEADRAELQADLSRQEADRSSTEADRAAQYANIVAPGFYVDVETMCLYLKAGIGVEFKVFDDNILCWKIA